LATAERQLSAAALASASEALLPAASLDAVFQRAYGKLRNESFDLAGACVSVHCNGTAAERTSRLRRGDHVVLRISMPSRPSLPSWIGRLSPWLADEELAATAKVVVP
jgi:hypothetical protein